MVIYSTIYTKNFLNYKITILTINNNFMEKGIVGVSGEYFVAVELSKIGIVATLTLKNTPKIDILATNLENGKYVNIIFKKILK